MSLAFQRRHFLGARHTFCLWFGWVIYFYTGWLWQVCCSQWATRLRSDARELMYYNALHIQTYWHPRLVGLLQHNALVLLTRRITRTG